MLAEFLALLFSSTVFIKIFTILSVLYFLRKFFQGGQFKSDDRIDGKVVIVTGCNTGLGKETALDLAKRGGKIYMACRNAKRCEKTRLEIIKKSGNQNVFNRTLDLASLESIRNFAKQFLAEEQRLDILINNAGVMGCPKLLTADGFEMQIGTNHMGHFLLTNLLLDCLKKSAPSRIVVVSSLAHKLGGIIKKDNLNSDKSYNRFIAYAHSKLANIYFTRHLAKLLYSTGVTVNALHPGVISTELSRYFPLFFVWLFYPLTSIICKSIKSGAQTTISVAVDPKWENTTGQYFCDCGISDVIYFAKHEPTAEWLWKTSEKWTGIKYNHDNNNNNYENIKNRLIINDVE